MKHVKHWGCILLVALLTAMTGCAQAGNGPKANDDVSLNIGVLQYMPHAALDASYSGFSDALKDAGYEDGKNITIDFQNASGDQSNCLTIADGFINDEKDLILTIATPAAQAVAMKTTKIPVLFTAVTDPVGSGLVESIEKPNRNVSGTSDLTPIAEQFKLLKQILPDVMKVAVLYSSNETNSIYQAEVARDAGTALGLDIIDATVSSSNEIQQVVSSIVDQVDAIYAPTDNMIALAMPTVLLVTNEAKIPVICGEESMISAGGLFTKGFNYYDLGYKTGQQAAKVLQGEEISNMPVEYLSEDQLKIAVNMDSAELLGITFPEDILNQVQ